MLSELWTLKFLLIQFLILKESISEIKISARLTPQWAEPEPEQEADDLPIHDQRLVSDLLDHSDYDKRVRPVRDPTTSVKVTLRFNLYQILNVEEPRQNVELYLWVNQYWTDEFLGWDPSEYGGLNKTVLPFDAVWLPDTYVYNSLEMTRESSERWINVMVSTNFNKTTGESSGDVKFQYPAIFKFSCKMDIFYFPFDMQNCTMEIGSWTFDSSGLDYFPYGESVLVEAFVPNEEWDLQSFEMTRSSKKYMCCPFPYTWVNAHLVIKRKPLYYLSNLVAPTVIISIISIIGFFMPGSTDGERSERVNLGLTTLLAMSILLLMVSESMPTTSDFIPLIGVYFLAIIVIISLGTFLTNIVILIQQEGLYGKRVSRAGRIVFFDFIAKILHVHPKAELEAFMKEEALTDKDCPESDSNMMNHKSAAEKKSPEEMHDAELHAAHNPTGCWSTVLKNQVRAIRSQLNRIQEMIQSEEGTNVGALEYEFLARILDRLFLVTFPIAILVATVSFLIIGALATANV